MKEELTKLLHSKMSRRQFLSLIGIAVLGVVALRAKALLTHADTSLGQEVEAGSKTGNATTLTDASAGAGSAIIFGQPPASRDSLVYGNYKPAVGATAGLVRPNANFTQVPSNITISTANTHYQDTEFLGDVTINTTGVVFDNCIFRGNATPAASDNACIKPGSQGHMGGAIIRDSLIQPQAVSPHRNGIWAVNCTVERCEIARCVDGIDFNFAGANTNIYGCVVHDCAYFKWDTTTGAFILGPDGYDSSTFPAFGDGHASGDTHCDAIQFAYGQNVNIIGNVLGGAKSTTSNPNDGDAYTNACIMLQQIGSTDATHRIQNVVISKNWFRGGAAAVNISVNKAVTPVNYYDSVSITDNTFFHDPTVYAILRSQTDFAGTISGNVYEDGSAIVVSNGA